jgi:thioredoxin 1
MSTSPDITDDTFEAEVTGAPGVTVVDLWAEWCQPCKRQAPILDQIAAEHAGRLKIVKLDVDSNPVVPMRYDISGIPTLLVFKDGQLVDTIVGFQPKDRLLDKLLPHLD